MTAVSAAITPERRRASMLLAVLPLSLLLLGVGLSPILAHPEHAVTIQPAASGISMESELGPPSEQGLKDKHRMVALDTVERLEAETRQRGGIVRISAVDLRRIRNALRQSE